MAQAICRVLDIGLASCQQFSLPIYEFLHRYRGNSEREAHLLPKYLGLHTHIGHVYENPGIQLYLLESFAVVQEGYFIIRTGRKITINGGFQLLFGCYLKVFDTNSPFIQLFLLLLFTLLLFELYFFLTHQIIFIINNHFYFAIFSVQLLLMSYKALTNFWLHSFKHAQNLQSTLAGIFLHLQQQQLLFSKQMWMKFQLIYLFIFLLYYYYHHNQMIGSLKNFINSKFTPTEKDFETKGVLSPEQFIQAGDQLTNFGWKWQKSLSKPNKLLENPNKQFLSANASSRARINKIASQQIKQVVKDGFFQVQGETAYEGSEQDFRNYTVYITYDEYYHTPRLWIKGNDTNGIPLNSKQIFQDVYAEYQNETVTEETMPYLEHRMLTIHPCKHSDVMKRFFQQSKEKGKKIKPHMALIIFLKFMSSVMPTIQYDQSLDIQI